MSGLDGLRVLALESRRAAELAKLISTYVGTPVVAPALTAPEPNTWRELLQALDQAANSSPEFRLRGTRVALQEYGVSNPGLSAALTERGAIVTRVPIYQWALPEDIAPLQSAIKELAEIGRASC